MNPRFGRRTTRDPFDNRVPMATSLWPANSGATSGSNASRLVDRSTSMYASTSASLSDQTCFSARPRPDCSSRTIRTPGNSAASSAPISYVASVLPLSAMQTSAGNGKAVSRNSRSRLMFGPRSFSSFFTGTTISTRG